MFLSFRRRFAVEPREFRNLPAIDLRGSESKFFLERLFQDMQISVFAKDQGKNKPIIPGADLAIRPLYPRNVLACQGETSGGSSGRFHPFCETRRPRGHCCGWKAILRVADSASPCDQDAIHDDVFAGGEILRDELMFGRHVGQEKIVIPEKRKVSPLCRSVRATRTLSARRVLEFSLC